MKPNVRALLHTSNGAVIIFFDAVTFSIRGRWTGNNHSINSGLIVVIPDAKVGGVNFFIRKDNTAGRHQK